MKRWLARRAGIYRDMHDMTLEAVLVALGAFGISAILTATIRKLALSRGWVDVPNGRSSHVTPTPRGGGSAIVVATTIALVALSLPALVGAAGVRSNVLAALGGGGLLVAAVGFADDRNSLSVVVRLSVHFAAALWALAWLGGLPPLLVGTHIVDFGWVGYPFGALAIVWVLNLFNFMDGIDGIAASEATFIGWGAVLLAGLAEAPGEVMSVSLAFGAATFGFLLWNWPPAKIFMGDVGSGYLGYVIVVLAIAAARDDPVALFVWLILGGVFFVDANVTFARRLARGEPVHHAHRNHGYQWLSRRLKSHRRVTVMVLLLNLLWLPPCACCAARWPRFAAWITVGTFVPLVVLAFMSGSGQRDTPLR
ncbi:MAG: glycosyltransferase family 4 protein [Gammaproteobacteria bacterium]